MAEQKSSNAAEQKSSNGKPLIESVSPVAAIPGGEFQVSGSRLAGQERPRVTIGDVAAPVLVGSESFLVARVPDGANFGEMVVRNDGEEGSSWPCEVGVMITDGVHPVANPVLDAEGNIFSTFSGSRGQKTPVSVFKIDINYQVKPFLTDLMNATGLAFDREGTLYVSSRYDGTVYQATPRGSMSVYVEGMGVATGLAFDREGNLYVGDRSGTIFKISPSRQIYVYATVEPSIAAYHLAFGPDESLYLTGPTTSSYDCVYRISPAGEVSVVYRGLGRPQGLAFDENGSLYVAASLGGRRGVVRLTPEGEVELFASGPGIVGLAFSPSGSLFLATNGAIYRVDTGIRGLPLRNQ